VVTEWAIGNYVRVALILTAVVLVMASMIRIARDTAPAEHSRVAAPSLSVGRVSDRVLRSARLRCSAGLLRRRAQENDSSLVTEHREETIAVLLVMQGNHKGLSIR
jgi:hypothetical protein